MLLIDVGYLIGVNIWSVLRTFFGSPLLDSFAVWFLVLVFMWRLIRHSAPALDLAGNASDLSWSPFSNDTP